MDTLHWRGQANVIVLSAERRLHVSTNQSFFIDRCKIVFASNSTNGHLYKATLRNPPGVYLPYSPGFAQALNPDNLTWTNLTVTTSTISSQLAAFGGQRLKPMRAECFPN
jgi:hypothetical protein